LRRTDLVRVAVVGGGFAGGSHVEGPRRVPGVEVALLAGGESGRARAAADAIGIERSTGDYREALADESIDVVHNCTPTDLHAEVTAAALDARKHVLAEKPLAMDSGETADLVERAAASGVRRRPTGPTHTFDRGGSGDTSQVSPGFRNRLTFEIDTADVSLGWDQDAPNQLWLGRRDRPSEQVAKDPTLLSPAAAALAHYPAGHQEGWADGLKNLMLDFYAGVRAHRSGESHPSIVATFDDAHRVTCTVEAVLESARDERWVHVNQTRGVVR
jgi:predicted dehydrogenase